MTDAWTGYRMLVCEVGMPAGPLTSFLYVTSACLFALVIDGAVRAWIRRRRNGR